MALGFEADATSAARLEAVEALATQVEMAANREAARQAAERAVSEATHALAAAATRRDGLASRLAEILKRRLTAEALRDAARRRAAKALDGEAPDALEARLGEALRAAEGRLSEGRDAAAEVARAQAAGGGKLEALRARGQTLAARAEAARAALAAALSAAGLSDAAALAALRLPASEVTVLSARREALVDALTRAEDRLAEATTALDGHRATRPAELPEGAATEAWRLRLEASRADLDDANQALGAARQQLDRQQAAAREHAELRRDWEQAREVADLWQRLHKLIGTRDGKAFQEFAQILNLQELIARANEHLRSLAPRYGLVTATDRTGRPRLDFAVRDGWLASRERPITTLSGGESFLVSLALALGLADMRTVEMPIETLLLDEGFGTLDPRSLDLALEGLSRLHAQGGVQVGIISHVEALRERVEARVVVEPLGGGRSRLRTELGGATT